jgi:succinyl-diaminopimelate desuccinylase
MARAEELTRLLESLVVIPSANPPGEEGAICQWIARWLEVKGIASHEIAFAPGRPSLWAEIPGREAGAVLLSGHLDTVRPAAGCKSDPFASRLEGARLYGLGATDMKGGVAMLLQTFREVAERARREGPPRHSLRLLLSADEEDIYRGAGALAQAGLTKDALFTLVAEPTDGQILVGERAEFAIRVSFTGKEAHGSTPGEGVNALLACTRFALELQDRLTAWPPDPRLGPATINIGRMEGGRQVNIVPDEAWAELDIRLGSEEVRARAIALIEEAGHRWAGPGRFTWSAIRDNRALCAPLEDPFLRSLVAAYVECRGEEPGFGVATFCTDLPSLYPQGQPAFAIFGPGDIAQAHQPEEFIELSSLERESAVLERFLLRALE